MKTSNIKEKYSGFFSGEIKEYFSPGRVNLIGEHIDYHGGQVFPIAINLGTRAIVSLRNDTKFHMLSINFIEKGEITRDMDDLKYRKEDDWANYLKGMILEFKRLGYEINNGLDIIVDGDLPNRAGLSSSASLELLIATILNDIFKLEISTMDLVKIAQKVENEYIGVNCGIMDQFAVAMGKRHYAINLNTMTLEYSYVPLKLDNYSLIITNTNMKRNLADSKYNERRAECDKGLKILKKNGYKVNYLCELEIKDLQNIRKLITDEVIMKRLEHVISENERSKNAVIALQNNDLQYFAKLMIESHESLSKKYQVSTVELDTLVTSYLNNGALGARMTGAGFGGCTVSLVPTKDIDEIISNVSNEYYHKFGFKASFYIVKTSDGARKI